jgi:hypothetical protein
VFYSCIKHSEANLGYFLNRMKSKLI